MSKKAKKEKKSKPKKVKAKKSKKDSVFVHPLKLRIAKKVDFLELDYIKSDKSKKWKPYYGKAYWTRNSKKEIENRGYTFNEDTDLESFNTYLESKQILIPINKFDS